MTDADLAAILTGWVAALDTVRDFIVKSEAAVHALLPTVR
jgi:hypothetical protein